MNWKHRAGALLLALAMTLTMALPSAFAAESGSLSLSPRSLSMEAGETRTLTVSLSGGTGAQTVTLQSSDRTTATLSAGSVTVSPGGSAEVTVTGVGEGSAWLIATAGALSDMVQVTVAASSGGGSDDGSLHVELSGETETTVGSPVSLSLRLLPITERMAGVTWSPSNLITESKFSGNTGTARFLSNATGTFDVTASVRTQSGETVSDTLRIQVNERPDEPVVPVPAVGIAMNQRSPVFINRTASTVLTAAVTPSNSTEEVEWELDGGSGVVRLVPDDENDRRCVVEGVNVGRATVVAKVGGYKTDPFVIEVSGILLDRTQVDGLYAGGDGVTLTATRYGAASSMPLVWESQSEPIASVVNGRVYPNSVGTAKIIVSAGTNFQAECTVTVRENVAGLIERSVSNGASYALSGVVSDLRSRCTEMTGESLRLIRSLSVAPSQGILHYNYTTPEYQGQGVGSEPYYLSPGSSLDRNFSNLTFVPAKGFTGDADISYIGESPEGKTFNGVIRIRVNGTGDVTYSTASNLPVTFRAEDFTAICRPKTGQEVRYVSFQQPGGNNKGTLYRTYSATAQYNAPVVSSDKFYRSSNPQLDQVTYLPAEDATGTVKITYLCVTTSGGSYTGTVTINVYEASSAEGRGSVNYTVAPGGRVALRAADFNDACRDATGSTLDYVYFDLPSASQGTLYLNYRSSTGSGTRVSASTRYYRSSSPQISSITFVAAGGFSGSVSIPFTAFDRSGESFRGTMVIRVSGDDSTVYYTTGVNRSLDLDGADFNEACRSVNGAALDYLTFEIPSSSRGRLYRDYRSSSSTGTSVTGSTRLYYRGDPAISDVTFVPARSFNGTVSVPFSGYDTSGNRFSGTMEITVGSGGSDDGVVSYRGRAGGRVDFSAGDFDDACREVTGSRLNYVRFTPPAARYGDLYYDYRANGSNTEVSSSTSYYRSGGSRLIDDVSFLISRNVTGTVSIDYTGWSTGGERFEGVVEISTGSTENQVISYNTSGSSVTMQVSDFRSACDAALGGTLDYIQFNSLPSGGVGQMRINGSYASTGVSYYAGSSPAISQLSFVPASGYQGIASLSYTGWDTEGRSHSGTVQINVNNPSAVNTNPDTSLFFTDLGGYSQEFTVAIQYLSGIGVVNGYGDGRFGPGQPISRGAFALMVCRAFNLSTGSSYSFPDVPADSVYAQAVASAKDLGVVQGDNGRYYPDRAITRQAAMTMICRAMRASGRTVPNVSASALSGYQDYRQVSEYARASVASLVELGAVRGSAGMRLNPTQSISRAQMALILYRVLTTG